MVDTTIAMNEGIKPNRLFVLSCVALCVTAMTFAIRAGMLNDLGTEFNLTKAQLGWTASMAFFGEQVPRLVPRRYCRWFACGFAC